MAALSSLATVVGAGASIYGNVRQAQQQQATNQAQVQIAQEQNALRQNELLAQAQADALQRQQTLQDSVASERASLAANGISPDSGSGAAVQGGLTERSAAAQAASDAALRARLAQGQISLLNPDNTATTLLQNAPGIGFVSRNLIA